MLYTSPFYSQQGDLSQQVLQQHPLSLVGITADVTALLTSGARAEGEGSMLSTARKGCLQPGHNTNLYNRILIDPNLLALGNLTSAQQRYVKVWNGFLTPMPFEGLSGLNVDGITLTQPIALPLTVAALRELAYSVAISTDGPAAIDGQFAWMIAGINYTVTITGNRVILLPVSPNWSSPVIETLEWKTDVLRAYSGKEQRRKLRSNARRGFEYNFMETQLAAQKFSNQLWGWQNRMFAMPVWTDPAVLTQPVSVTSSDLILNTATFSFQVGGIAVLMGETINETVEILSVTPQSIGIKNGLQNSWDAGAIIYPLVIGHLDASVGQQRHTDTVLTGKIALLANPGVSDPYTPVAAAPTSYNGYEVITQQPNWKQAITFNNEFKFDVVDSETGVMEYLSHDIYPRVIRAYSWMLTTRADILAFRQFLGRMSGQLKTCWVPTWTQDFTVTRKHFSSDTSLTIVPNEYRAMINASPGRNTIMIRLRDGTRLYRTIIGTSTEGVNDALALDSPLGRDIATTDIAGIHMMLLSRFAADQINLEWQTSNVVVVQLSFTSVPPQ